MTLEEEREETKEGLAGVMDTKANFKFISSSFFIPNTKITTFFQEFSSF